jgi:hypothetical protein
VSRVAPADVAASRGCAGTPRERSGGVLRSLAPVALVALTASVGHAEPLDAPPRDRSYSTHLLASDGLALAFETAAFLTDESRAEAPLATSAKLTFDLGGPLIHLIHFHPVRAAASVGLRLVLPLVAGYVQSRLDGGRDGLGTGIGAIAAAVIDDGLLGRDLAFRF